METMLKIKDVAKRLNLSVETVYKWVHAGMFPNAIRISTPYETQKNMIRIPEGDVEALMQNARVAKAV